MFLKYSAMYSAVPPNSSCAMSGMACSTRAPWSLTSDAASAGTAGDGGPEAKVLSERHVRRRNFDKCGTFAYIASAFFYFLN